MKARKVRKLLRKRRRTGESTKTAAKRLVQDSESNAFIANAVEQWLKNKHPVPRPTRPTNHVTKTEAPSPPPKSSKGGKKK